MGISTWDELVTPANPAAGANFVRLVPGITWERAISIEATFTTDAVVVNRFPFVAYADGDSVEYYHAVAGAALAATGVLTVTWSTVLDTNVPAGAGFAGAPLRDEELPAGYHLVVGLTGADVGDQVSNVRLRLRRTPTGPMAPAFGAKVYSQELGF